MRLDGEITVGNLLTIFSVLVSVAALAYGWRKDRELRRMEYADRVRRATGTVVAKLDRWPALILQFFDDVQPLLLEVEYLAGKVDGDDEARKMLQRGLYEQRSAATQRIAGEDIETAYVDLYGYDPRIQALYSRALRKIRVLDQRAFARMRVIARGALTEPADAVAAAAWRPLLEQVEEAAGDYARDTEIVLAAFRAELLKIIEANDRDILRRTFQLSAAEDVLPDEQ